MGRTTPFHSDRLRRPFAAKLNVSSDLIQNLQSEGYAQGADKESSPFSLVQFWRRFLCPGPIQVAFLWRQHPIQDPFRDLLHPTSKPMISMDLPPPGMEIAHFCSSSSIFQAVSLWSSMQKFRCPPTAPLSSTVSQPYSNFFVSACCHLFKSSGRVLGTLTGLLRSFPSPDPSLACRTPVGIFCL